MKSSFIRILLCRFSYFPKRSYNEVNISRSSDSPISYLHYNILQRNILLLNNNKNGKRQNTDKMNDRWFRLFSFNVESKNIEDCLNYTHLLHKQIKIVVYVNWFNQHHEYINQEHITVSIHSPSIST